MWRATGPTPDRVLTLDCRHRPSCTGVRAACILCRLSPVRAFHIVGKAARVILIGLLCNLLFTAGEALAQEPPALVALHLEDGTILIGEVISEDAKTIRLRTKTMGEIVVDVENIESRSTPAAAAAAPILSAPPVNAPPEHTAVAKWTRAVTAGATWVSPGYLQGPISPTVPALTGAALSLPGAQASVQAGFSLQHSSKDDAFELSGNYTYVDVQPGGVVTERTAVDLESSWLLTPRTYLITRTSFSNDKVKNIDNSFTELLGVGRKIVNKPRFRFDVVGGGVLLRESKDTKFDDTYQPQVGAMESFVFSFTARASLAHQLIYRQGVREREIWSIESSTGLQGALTSRLSINLNLTWNHDNLLRFAETPLPPGAFPGAPAVVFATNPTFRRITSGLQFSF